MAAGIYKKGQGYWTRMMSAVAAGALVFIGAVWLWDTLAGVRIGSLQTVYVQAGAAVIFIGVLGVICYLVLGVNRKVVDFMIATEGEMKKVNWSTRREIMGSTWIVIGLTFVIAVIIGVLDMAYSAIFQALDVLETAG
jgi:preprotein translocase subunit SecE